MKRPVRMAAFFAVPIVIVILILLFTNSRFAGKSNTNKSYPAQNVAAYRFVCLYSGSSEYYKYALKEGLDKASEELNVWVKYYKFKSFESEKHCEAFDMALAAKVDGIITNIPVNGEIQKYIEAAYGEGIPVITIENDLPKSKRVSFIGTNSYAYGSEAAKLMIAATDGKSKTAIFKNLDTSKLNLKYQGFQNTIKNYPDMSSELFNINEPSIIEYTNVAQSIFVNHTQIDSFFCNDAESTIGAVRAMVEFNKTNKIVVGSGDSEEILKYIKDGIIYASLVEDPYSIGYLSVNSLLKYKKGEGISQLVNPDIIVITKDNVDKVLAERKDK